MSPAFRQAASGGLFYFLDRYGVPCTLLLAVFYYVVPPLVAAHAQFLREQTATAKEQHATLQRLVAIEGEQARAIEKAAEIHERQLAILQSLGKP